MLDTLLKSIDKKMLYIGGGVIVFIIILIGLASCSSSGTTSTGERLPFKKDDYSKVEETLVQAAKDYYSTYPQRRPDPGETIEIKSNVLSNKEYMFELSEYFSEDIKCTAKVAVTNVDETYVYTPYLDCGKHYSAVPLSEYIIDYYKEIGQLYNLGSDDAKYDENIDRTGLYYDENTNEYYFRGTPEYNFVEFGSSERNASLWRISSIDANGFLHLISHKTRNNSIWDNSYNLEFNDQSGTNDFNISVMRSRIEEYLNTTTYNYFNDLVKNKMVKNKWCIGARDEADSTINGVTECATLSEDAYIGLISVYEYLRSSLDNRCTTATNSVCRNYNYLVDNSETFWSLTPVAGTTNQIYTVGYSGRISDVSRNSSIKPMIILNKTTIKTGGTGSEKDAFTIK